MNPDCNRISRGISIVENCTGILLFLVIFCDFRDFCDINVFFVILLCVCCDFCDLFEFLFMEFYDFCDVFQNRTRSFRVVCPSLFLTSNTTNSFANYSPFL